MQAVFPEGGSPPIAPYSPAIKANGFVFVSGQIGVDSQDKLGEGLEQQARLALGRVKTVLEAAGSNLSKVVKATVFLTNMGDFGALNAVYGEVFAKPHPARSCIGVKELPRGAIVEVEVIALQ